MAITYEWDCETVADGDSSEFEDGECIDHYHGESFNEVVKYSINNKCKTGFKYSIVLVRDDIQGRSWAYIENSELPVYFIDADGKERTKVPQKFIKEVTMSSLFKGVC